MAINLVEKIQLVATSNNKKKILNILQDFGTFHINDINDDSVPAIEKETEELQKIDLNHANTEFAIKLLSPYQKKKGFLAGPIELTQEQLEEKAKDFDYKSIIKQCLDIEETITKANNELTALNNEYETYKPWRKLKTDLKNLSGTTTSNVVLGYLKTAALEEAIKNLESISKLITIEKVEETDSATYLILIFNKDLEKEVKKTLAEFKFTESELPLATGLLKEYLETTKESIKENESIIGKAKEELKKLSKNLDNLKIVFDYLSWQKEKLEAVQNFANTQQSFIISGWVPKKKLEELENMISKETKEFAISKLELEEGETPPVIIQNSNLTSPFETLTRMYGLPKHDELDPTPYLSVFFVVFFALCLTDAGYGIVMFAVTALALKFLKLGEGTKRLVKLLMYGGLVTAIIGAIFGGWFGFVADDMPEFLTYTNADGEKMFLLQQINSVTNPLAVLILALGLGFFQILVGIYMKFFHTLKHGDKKEAILGTGMWAFMLTGIGFFILTAAGVLPAALGEVGKWWVIIATIGLVLTQGRDKKNPIAKLLSGILSLYGLVGYMSDVLSYSRLLALGLATSIIGLAVNVIVNLAAGIPYIGWLFAIVIFIGGHVFNLLINTLGSFIHSGRLQFVEFFSKFMEGGGKEFKPLSKKNRYVFLKNN